MGGKKIGSRLMLHADLASESEPLLKDTTFAVSKNAAKVFVSHKNNGLCICLWKSNITQISCLAEEFFLL